jgi:hypothetical protein
VPWIWGRLNHFSYQLDVDRSIARRVLARFLRESESTDLWTQAQKDLSVFNQRYEEVHRFYEGDSTDALEKLLYDFAFRKNGTAPSFIGENFQKWMSVAFRPTDIVDPDIFRPPGVMIMAILEGKGEATDFLSSLDAYRNALQAVINATAPATFTYQGFSVENKQHLGDQLSRQLLEGVDYVTALFKKRGLEKLLKNEISKIELVPTLPDALGLYWSASKKITLSAALVGMGTGRFIKWVNEAFLHEFGHHIHMNYITGEARAVWDSGWEEVKEKQEVLAKAFQKITHEERHRFFEALNKDGWDPSDSPRRVSTLLVSSEIPGGSSRIGTTWKFLLTTLRSSEMRLSV